MRALIVRGWTGKEMLPPVDLSGPISTYEWLGRIDCELLQFTGLADKNGVDIFEGDIVRMLCTDWMSKSDSDPRSLEQYLIDLSCIYTVNYDCKDCGFELMHESGYPHRFHGFRPHGFIEVIGNIHQNPELLADPQKQ